MRNRLEKQQQTQEVVQKNSRPSLDRGLASIDSAASSMTGTTSLAIDNAQNTSANLSAEQAANYKLYSAKKRKIQFFERISSKVCKTFSNESRIPIFAR